MSDPIGVLTFGDGISVVVDQPIFRIGRNPAITDYRILDNQTISRLHAVITRENGNFYIVDSDSTCGTFVNNQKIGSEPFQLVAGDIIRLADLEMTFDIN